VTAIFSINETEHRGICDSWAYC